MLYQITSPNFVISNFRNIDIVSKRNRKGNLLFSLLEEVHVHNHSCILGDFLIKRSNDGYKIFLENVLFYIGLRLKRFGGPFTERSYVLLAGDV